MTEWLKLMLEEIARKQAERENARAEEALRAREPARARADKTSKHTRDR